MTNRQLRRSLCSFLVAVLALPACDDTRDASEGGSAPGVDMRPRDLADMGPSVADGAPVAADAAPDGPPIWMPGDAEPLVDAAEPIDRPDARVSPPDADAPDADAAVPETDAGVRPIVPRDPQCDAPVEPFNPPRIDLGARCRARRGPIRIRDLRDERCPDHERLPEQQPGREVELEEAVVTGVYGNDFSVQDPEGGPWSGLWVFQGGRRPPAGVVPGARVRLSGEIFEFYTLTELVPGRNGIEVLRAGALPEPVVVADPARIADGGDLTEPLESLLLEVRDVHVTNTAPDCPRDFGEFLVTGSLRIDDEAPFDYVPARDDLVRRVAGVLHYKFEHWKLLPRGDADLEAFACGGIPDKCEGTPCPVEADAEETGRLVISEIQVDPRGDDLVGEYIELFNPGPERVDLRGWRVQDCADRRAPLAGSIPAGGYYVLAAERDPDLNGGVQADADMGDLFLPNGYGSVLVFDADGQLVDQVRYEPANPWPRRRSGQSLELANLRGDNREGAQWRAGAEEYGDGGSGTPGEPYRQ